MPEYKMMSNISAFHMSDAEILHQKVFFFDQFCN